jgi:hypothetical protein
MTYENLVGTFQAPWEKLIEGILAFQFPKCLRKLCSKYTKKNLGGFYNCLKLCQISWYGH